MKNKLKVLLSLLAVCSVLGATTACGLLPTGDSSKSESSSVSESINESSDDTSSDTASDTTSDTASESSSDSTPDSSVVAPTTYTVKFVDEDGTEISTGDYELGDEVTVPADPEKAADDEYTYTFAGWDKDVTAVEGSATYTATYTKTPITYTVTFKADGAEDVVREYNADNKEIEVPEVPAKDHYTGAWEAYELTTGNITVNAKYTAIEYTVAFMNGEDVVEKVAFSVEDNEKAAPAIPEKTGYTGVWDEYSFSKFEDQTVSLNYTANTYKITYDAGSGTCEVTEQEVTYDAEYTLVKATPSKFYQEHLGWVDEYGNKVESATWNIASDITLTAQYSNVITFDSMTEVPSYLQNGGRASLAIVDGNGGKVLQATSENNDQGNVRIMMPLTYMAEFFEDPDVQYMAFDLKLPEGATTGISSIMYHNLDQSNYTAYESGQFDAPPTDAVKSYYLPRSVYETWVANGKTEGRFLNVQEGITQGASYWIDNIRPVTADEYIQDFYSFEHGGVRLRKDGSNQPLFYLNSDMSGWQLGISNVDETAAKYTSEIVSDGNRAFQFTKYSGESVLLMCHFADPTMEVAMREAGYISFDLYVPEGSDAQIKKNGQTWYGTLQQGWNTVYERIDADVEVNEIIRFTDTTASTYVIDNFRLLTEEEYHEAMCGFETGGVIRHNNSSDDTTSAGWAYYYAGWDKANNKASIQVNEGNGENDLATLSNVRFATEKVHSGEYSFAFDKKAGYMSLGMSTESEMYSLMKNGFTFWIYSTVDIDGVNAIYFINGDNKKFNGGEGITIEANTWTQITVTAEDINATGRFLILQGDSAGTIYIDDLQPLPTTEAE